MLKAREEHQEDLHPQETREWLEALDEIIDVSGPDRASYILDRLQERAASFGVRSALRVNTPYVNTIPPEEEVPYPGDRALERRIKSLVRWNAVAMVVRANKYDEGIGGHISTYASAATPVGGRIQSLLPRIDWRPARRPGLLPGPCFPGRLCPRVSGGASVGEAPSELPP